ARRGRHVLGLALGLKSLGIGRGERVGLVSENRPEWVIADLAIMSAAAITVPAYVTHTVDDHRHVLANSGARAVIVSKPPLSARVLAAANQVSTVHTVITIEPGAGQASGVDVLPWEEVLARGGRRGGRLRRPPRGGGGCGGGRAGPRPRKTRRSEPRRYRVPDLYLGDGRH